MSDTHRIENFLVIDFKTGSTRTRKSEPGAADLGKNEIVTELCVDVVIPEPTVEALSARVELPEPTVTETDLADVDPEDVRDWRDVADAVLADETDQFIGTQTIDGDRVLGGTVDWERWRDARAQYVLDVLESSPGRPEIDDVVDYLNDIARDRAEELRTVGGDDDAE